MKKIEKKVKNNKAFFFLYFNTNIFQFIDKITIFMYDLFR